jgi:hypothetical protein
MKKILFFLFLMLRVSVEAQSPINQTLLIPQATNSVTTGVLNTGKGAIRSLPDGITGARIDAYAAGTAASTNGSIVFYLETAVSTTGPYTIYSDSNIKLSATGTGAATNSCSDYFNLTGVRYIRMGAISNSTAGTFTNPVLTITYPLPSLQH